MRYQIENGLLFHDDKPVFALGQSYYPSYHRQKVPVLETGDRLGEMKKDLSAIKAAGFNIVRMAALGDVDWNGGDVKVQFDLPDAFCQNCEAEDMAAMIRLQGYSMNLRNFPDTTMVDQNGKSMEFSWGWFVRNCLNHPGILEDNAAGTTASAAHFAAFSAVTSFQIYNEPAYPTEGFFDYHPETLKRFVGWCGDHGLPPMEAPKRRPAPGEDTAPWVYWRLFLLERLNGFICDMGREAKKGYSKPSTLTCHMGCPVMPGAAIRGEDYFATAQGMDILGITSYTVNRGPSFHQAAMVLDCCESAAATFGKKAWLIEYNARTGMPPQEWPRETYAAIGRGFKGILYYQWRADYPFPDGPEPNGFGMVFNDGQKASSFDMGVAMNQVINRISTDLVTAEKVRDGIGILYSNHANAMSDAMDNGLATNVADCHERSILSMRRCYTLLNEQGLTVDFARAEDLARNPLGIRVLVLPFRTGLSEKELDEIEAFASAGGKVYQFLDSGLGFEPFDRYAKPMLHGVVTEQLGAGALCVKEGIASSVQLIGCHDGVDVRLLRGEKDLVAVLTNYDPLERPIRGAELIAPDITEAVAYAENMGLDGCPLTVNNGHIILPELLWGAFIIMH